MLHIDEWLDAPSADDAERYAKKCLEVARMSAADRWELPKDEQNFLLFCTYRDARYRCTGASRLGDVWLTADYKQDTGYQKRVDVAECFAWSSNA